ncbi:hypothetical protein A374_07221 [Fictibacillus macauensis ZFHKF-1]|uniref:Uncharacterized protein n=1 Tax=Fictibacillus macauensis ZFHKF-1 TaxID=1196324 RepID=I8AJX1_9BACL|nr:hypothetical protein A374_07221 [Fictibacillus macauensis ZFHKF-1]
MKVFLSQISSKVCAHMLQKKKREINITAIIVSLIYVFTFSYWLNNQPPEKYPLQFAALMPAGVAVIHIMLEYVIKYDFFRKNEK